MSELSSIPYNTLFVCHAERVSHVTRVIPHATWVLGTIRRAWRTEGQCLVSIGLSEGRSQKMLKRIVGIPQSLSTGFEVRRWTRCLTSLQRNFGTF